MTPDELIDLAYRASTPDELTMARELLMKRVNSVSIARQPEEMGEELGCLELVEQRISLLPPELRPAGWDTPMPEEIVPEEELPELPDSTEAGLRDRLGV